jgi:hypothetical protein
MEIILGLSQIYPKRERAKEIPHSKPQSTQRQTGIDEITG